MFLPFTIFALLCVIGLALLIFGALGWSNDKGIAFFVLAGLLFLITGLITWTSGLQLNEIESIETVAGVSTMTYQTISATDGSPLWIISNILFFGGLLVMLVGFGRLIQLGQIRRDEDAENYY